jgi:hypothetical protein
MAPRPVKIASIAGIKRDGTQFEGDYYVDGQWCRFQRKLPRKMGGYRLLSKQEFNPTTLSASARP